MPRPADSASSQPGISAATDSSRNRFLVRTTLILAFGVLGITTFDYPSATRIQSWPWAALATALFLMPVGALMIGIVREPSWRLPPLALWGGSVLLAAGTLASAAFSPFSSASLPRVWPALGGISLYLWLHHRWSVTGVASAASLERVARGLALAGIILITVSLIHWVGRGWPWPWVNRNDAPFGHSTYTAGAVILVLPWLAQQAWTTAGIVRLAWTFGIGAALVVLAGTSSRGGVLALALTGLLGVIIFSFHAPWSRRRKLFVAGVVLAVGAATVLTNPRLRELIVERQWSEVARESNTQRQAMFDAGLRLGVERPWLGWGPGSIPLAYPRVRAFLEGGTENSLQLHNTPVQIWATLGSAGAIAMALLVGGALAVMVRVSHTPITVATSASLFGYAIVALTDHQLDVPAIAALVAVNLAVLTASVQRPEQTRYPSQILRSVVCLVLTAMGILGLGATVPDLRARWHYDNALTALAAGRTQEFLQALDRATQAAPHDPFFQHLAAAWLLDLRATVKGPAERAALTQDASVRLKRSLASGVHEEIAHFNLGWLDLELDRPRDAVRHFSAAARLVPDKRGVYFGLGLAHLAAENHDGAVRAFALEAINDPRSITSPAWELPRLAALQPAVRVEVLRLLGGLRKDYALTGTIEAWLRWWWGEAVSEIEMRPGFNAESARFLAALPTITAGEVLPENDAAWSRAYAAWRTGRQSEATAGPEAFLRASSGDRPFAEALARRVKRHSKEFRDFLAAPSEDEPALVRTLRHQRRGYGVLALHPEGPPLNDVFVVQQNRVAADLAAGLFPAKGWLPGRFLLALLPENPR